MLERILLTNDDGIEAPGLEVLEAIASELAREVWVVAPEHDQSGVSHAISLHHALRVSHRGPRRFGISGTPGDCAVMGIGHLMTDGPPDLLLSGVNRGLNLGMETVFSGTVGGAMTGMMLGVPSIGLSQAYKDRNNPVWDASRTLGARVVRELLARRRSHYRRKKWRYCAQEGNDVPRMRSADSGSAEQTLGSIISIGDLSNRAGVLG